MDYYGRHAHFYNFGQFFDHCLGRPDCTGPGGTPYSRNNFDGNFQQWSTRVYTLSTSRTLLKVLPETGAYRKAVVHSEYGLESPLCLLLGKFISGMYIMDGLKDTIGTCLLLWHIPSRAESWLRYEPPEIPGRTKEEAETMLDQSEFDFVRVRGRGMPTGWKSVNFCLVVIPKFLIWLLPLSAGTRFLIDTASSQDLITNTLAMAFVLTMDELPASRLWTEATKGTMKKLDSYVFHDPSEIGCTTAAMETYKAFEYRYHIQEGTLIILLMSR